MRIFLTNLSINGINDGLKDHFASYGLENSPIELANIVLFYLTYQHNHVFDHSLANIIRESKKPIAVFDYLEYGGHRWHREEYHYQNLVLGENYSDPEEMTTNSCHPPKDYYSNLISFLTKNKPSVYFLREKSVKYKYPKNVFPIDYCNPDHDEVVTDTLDQFSNRPIDILYNWGFTNHDRGYIYGDLTKLAYERDYHIAHSLEQVKWHLNNKTPRLIALLHNEYYERIPHHEMKNLYAKSKATLDIGGCGIKCFRNYESAINNISVKQIADMEHVYPWVDYENCLITPEKKDHYVDTTETLNKIEMILKDKNRAYYIYRMSQSTAIKYRMCNYISSHIMPKITKFCTSQSCF